MYPPYRGGRKRAPLAPFLIFIIEPKVLKPNKL